MAQQTDTPPDVRRELPMWVLPAVIFGAIAIVAALVTFALTIRDLPSTTTTITANSLPADHPAISATAATDGTALPSAHGGLDPNGAKVTVISLAEARAKLDAGEALFIDVRAGSDYTAGHIPGALTITSQDLEARLNNLPAGSSIIAYGDASRPESGQRGAQIFMDLGYPTVIALEGGFQDWQQAGNPVEK
ncbi:rhodanese-like domain-containing protein [Oscillochloris sp. ZM17-4]|uniref:rhodanese-like domain-containing protein n=1 Tax=Oscillochloris sp. ZM17-4 TaxID=2866714 RepID=UPI001C73C344|nr:rhodanese-like domain-containing protein [Oscillochloris sp. ZM17-4]MBX0327352.1 rhodanese-like domain-containing protein [Oscillochloris sp. ZM17-4]